MIRDLWYKNAVFYCLSVGTYMDANGDGIGDFQGLMRRLDYLHGLGVTAIWLMPFQKSPGKDDGYDISDYYEVNPAFGSLGDFVEFTHGAQQRGIRVIIDLVVNHTSIEHPWSQEARRDPNSKYRDWYIWSKKRPPHAEEGMVFPGVQKATWSRDPVAKQWYFHRFYKFQPDLNTSHPDVQAEFLKIMGFWIQLGVSGFRMDAVPFIISTKSVLRARRRRYASAGQGDEKDRAAAGQRTMGIFLRNHDELDLGRLTKKQRRRVFDAFGPNPEDQLYNRGIRRRLAPMLNGDRRRLELAYSLMFTLPGTPVLRYGDELAMGDDLSLPERVCARTPMQWSAEPNGGFTTSDKPIVPVISEGPYGYQYLNAATQRREPNSMLNWTERIVRMRKEVPEIGWGQFEILPVRDPRILVMRYDWRDNSVLFAHNLSDTPREVAFSTGLPGREGRLLVNLLTENHSQAGKDGKHHLILEAYGYRWYRVGGLDYLLKRTDIEVPPPA